MLVLNRHIEDSIIINGNIEIKIVDVRRLGGNPQVRLGITAPRDVSVHRKEIQEAIDREKNLSGSACIS